MSSPSTAFISPTGPGSLGDQAMLDAATTEVITAGGMACVFPHAPALRGQVRIVNGEGALGTAWAAARAILSMSRVAYIGADVVDGVYGVATSLKRLKTLTLARRLGKQARVMGSSWSPTPAPKVAAFLRTHPELEILARDPVSQRRMEADLGREVQLVADLAFLLRSEVRSPAAQAAVCWAKHARAQGAQILGVNLSGHTVRTMPDKSVLPLAKLVMRWLDASPARRIMLMPHDVRPGFGGDLKVLKSFADTLADQYAARMHVPVGTLDAWDAKAIAGEVDLVLTGRMHLAIASLGQGTPPVSVIYQGKFEGLMEHFGLTGLTFPPEAVGTTPDPDAQLSAASDNSAVLSAQIKAELPRIKELARANFAGF